MREDPGAAEQTLPLQTHSRRFKIGLIVAALGGFLIRAYYVWTVQSGIVVSKGDSFLFYWLPAQQLAKGRGYISARTFAYCTWDSNDVPQHVILDIPDRLYNLCQVVPSAKHPPGFVTLLAGLDKLGFQSMASQRYWMSILGSITIILIGLLAAKIVNERAGIIAAIIAAIYPNVWLSDTAMYAETLMSFGFVLGLVGVYGFWKSPSWKYLLVASVGFTLAASARSEMIALFGLVLVPLVLARTIFGWRKRFALLVLAAIVPLAVFVPWFVYNTGRFENTVVLSTGLGPTMLASTCSVTYYTNVIGLYSPKCMEGEPPVAPASIGLDESQVNSYSKRKAIDYAKAHPGRTVLAVAAREGRLVELWKPGQQNVFNHFVQGRGSLTLVKTSQRMFYVLGLLSIAGIVLWRRRKIPLYPLVAEFALTVLVVSVTFGSTRYRAAAEWCLILLAATTLDAMIRWFMTWWRNRTGNADAPPDGIEAADTSTDRALGVDGS